MTAMTDHRMLSRKLTIGSIDDLEALSRSVVAKHLRTRGGYLDPDDRDDLLAYVLGEASVYAEAKERAGANGTLTGTVVMKCHSLCVDWYRDRFGRTGHKRPHDRNDPEKRNATMIPLDDVVRAETSDRPLETVYGQARLQADTALTDWDRWLIVSSDLTVAELAAKTGMTPKQAARYRAELRQSAAHLREDA